MSAARQAGRLFGVGVGPGDPDLVTVKAQRTIGAAGAVAFPAKQRGGSLARRAAAPWLAPGQEELELVYPVTTAETDHPRGYEGALREFYDEAAERIATRLQAGIDVAVLCEGDPFFYGSYMYLHERLAPRYPTEVIPGVTAFCAAAAAAGTPLAQRDDVLSVLPGTLPPPELAERLRGADAAVVMKLGRQFGGVREAAGLAGVAGRSVYVERASTADERIFPLAEVEGEVPYMSTVLVPTLRDLHPGPPPPGRSLAVVGLGPAGPEWLTPEASAVLAASEELVGYAQYLDRLPHRAGQGRHASDNRVELDRARHALELAAAGASVAVVSSGDPGIFAMAAAVLEAVEAADGEFAGVKIRIVPGLSAMHAAAARAGAPLGHDFAVISLSDQLKPWEVIERRLDAAAAADLALALYNPASRTRREQLERAREVLLRHRGADCPVVVARDLGGSAEAVTITTLGGFAGEQVDMRTLLIVGSSTTRVIRMHDGGQQVYTPRSYPG